MEETTTTIKVYKRDAARLFKRFGAPQPRAFHLALNKLPCVHPENRRKYTTALVSILLDGAVSADPSQNRTIHGFRCGICGRYVFQGQEE